MRARALALVTGAATLVLLASCGGDDDDGGPSPVPSPTASSLPVPAPTPSPSPTPTPTTTAVSRSVVATFDNPWAMAFLPDGRLLVTEKGGALRLATVTGAVSAPISGLPAVAAGGQSGLLDVAVDPAYASNRRIWWSYSEAGSGGKGTALARGTLTIASDGGATLSDVAVIWRQTPKVSGDGHFGGRIAFSPDNKVFLTAGERQQGSPAQDLSVTLGKVIRLNLDGSIPSDNPFVGTAGARSEIWSYGHRNPYGLVFASDGRLFESEMGPAGGDEFNLVMRGANYGWDAVSEGDRYNNAGAYPRHSTNTAFAAPLVAWTPVISPSGMIHYTGTRFDGWTGDFVLAGLSAQGLVRVRVSGTTAREVARLPLQARIREVEQGPDGAIWVLEDGAAGRLIRLDPV